MKWWESIKNKLKERTRNKFIAEDIIEEMYFQSANYERICNKLDDIYKDINYVYNILPESIREDFNKVANLIHYGHSKESNIKIGENDEQHILIMTIINYKKITDYYLKLISEQYDKRDFNYVEILYREYLNVIEETKEHINIVYNKYH
ncbi:MAG: hypothetical protein J6D03_03260 [Clostridia bacterium]|nr:hypothetical protein [Clostridia bacterium]